MLLFASLVLGAVQDNEIGLKSDTDTDTDLQKASMAPDQLKDTVLEEVSDIANRGDLRNELHTSQEHKIFVNPEFYENFDVEPFEVEQFDRFSWCRDHRRRCHECFHNDRGRWCRHNFDRCRRC
jgi:hypothetical protein